MAKESKRGFQLRKILAENIRLLRKEKNLSQEELADLCGLHRTYVGSVERQERNVTLSSLESFSLALKIQPADLLRTSNDSNFSSDCRKHKKKTP